MNYNAEFEIDNKILTCKKYRQKISVADGRKGPNCRKASLCKIDQTCYFKIEAYQKWAEQQVKNAEKQLGTAGR